MGDEDDGIAVALEPGQDIEKGGDLEQDYTPPPVDANGTGHVLTSYNLDQNITSIAPDGIASTLPNYDGVNGRLLTLGFSAGTTSKHG